MSKSLKLINYLETQGNNLAFFTELNSDINVGDKVFIVGGNYDNTVYTDKNSNLFDPYHKFASGYSVVSIDSTNLSNRIVLNILTSDIDILNIKDVYNSANGTKEAYISTSYFRSGEFNGGTFVDGIIGNNNDDRIVFNNKFNTETPASINDAIFLGGDYNFGLWDSNKLDKTGKFQSLNELGEAYNTGDDSLYNITYNNNDFGKSYIVNGNFGKIYENNHSLTISSVTINSITTNTITFNDYMPYEIKKVLESYFDYSFQIKIVGYLGDRIFDFNKSDINLSNKTLNIPTTTVFVTNNDERDYTVEQIMVDSNSSYRIEIYIKDNTEGIRNSINKTTMYSPIIFSGSIDDSWIQGGIFNNGMFNKGKISAIYDKMVWNNGIFNGIQNLSLVENLRWNNGIWVDGNWRGDSIVSIKNYKVESNKIYIYVLNKYGKLFDKNEKVFLSYFKDNNGKYLENFTDVVNTKSLNFSDFQISDINEYVEDVSKFEKHLTEICLENSGIDLTNVSIQYAKVSTSYFKKGIWNNGIWESGYRNTSVRKITSIEYPTQNTQEFILGLDSIEDLYIGDIVEASNIEVVRTVKVKLNVEDVHTEIFQYLETLDKNLTINHIDILNKKITVRFDSLNTIKIDDRLSIVDTEITAIRFIKTDNELSILTQSLWCDGDFRSGAWNGGIFRNGKFGSSLYFDKSNNSIQSVIQQAYIKNATFDNVVMLSGVFEKGIINKAIITNNSFNEINSTDTLNIGDTIINNAIINDVEYRRGILSDSIINGGVIINGSFENVEFNGGSYTNGFNVYNGIIANRSGEQKITTLYDNFSAPSIIYIDKDGWVQLDQESYFQKNYNVVFKDLDTYDNRLNGQMFSVRDTKDFGTKIKIDNIDNETILIIDNLKDFAQYDNDTYLLLDSSNNRIVKYNGSNGNVEVLGKLPLSDIYNFTKLSFIAYYNSSIFVIDDNTLRVIKNDTIFNYVKFDNNIVSMFNVESTIFCLDDKNNIYYTNGEKLVLLVIDKYTNIKQIFGIKNTSSNSVDLFILNNNVINHLVLDKQLDNTYLVKSVFLIKKLNIDNITSFCAIYNDIDININLFIVSNSEKIHKFNYNEFRNGKKNVSIILNDNKLDNPIYSIKMSIGSKLLLLLKNQSIPLMLSTSDIIKNTKGIGNPLSNVRLFDNGSENSFWIYDDATNRIVYTKDSKYSDTDVDTTSEVDTVYDIVKMTNGESSNVIYSIQINFDGVYSLRKTERGLVDSDNSVTYKVIDNTVSTIYDLKYVDKLCFLCKRGSVLSIGFITNGTFSYIDTAFTTTSINKIKFDIVSKSGGYEGVISLDNQIHYFTISGIIFGTYEIGVSTHNIYDVAFTNNMLFYTTDKGCYKIYKDSDSNITANGLDWSILDYKLYDKNIITQIDILSTTAYCLVGNMFVKFYINYEIEDNTYSSLLKISNKIYGISNDRVVYSDSDTSETIKIDGIIDQSMVNSTIKYISNNVKDVAYSTGGTGKFYFSESDKINFVDTNAYSVVRGLVTGNIIDICGNNTKIYFIESVVSTFSYINASDNTISSTSITYPLNTIRFSVNNSDTFVALTSDGNISYKIGANAFVSLLTEPDVNIKDVVIDSDNNIFLLYKNNTVSYIPYNTSYDIANLSYFSKNNVLSINENNEDSTKILIYDGVSADTISIDPNNVNVDIIDVKDFDNSTTYTFLYNDSITTKGVIRQLKNSKSILIKNQINNLSTSTFIKMISIDDDNCFVLFEDGLYLYNFYIKNVTKISIPSIVSNLDTSDYSLKPVDITKHDTSLLIAYNYIHNNVDTNYYDLFLYKYDFAKLSIDKLPITLSGDKDTVTYNDFPLSFYSEVNPKIHSNQKNITLYFGATSSADFLRITDVADITNIKPLVANIFDDYVFKLTSSSFNKNAEDIVSVTIYSGTDSLTSTNFGTGDKVFVSGTEPLSDNEFWVVFENSSFINTNSDFKFDIKTTIKTTRITSTTYNNGINNFVSFYNNGVNICIEDILKLKSLTNTCSVLTPSTAKWNISNYSNVSLSTLVGSELEYLAPASPLVNSTFIIKNKDNDKNLVNLVNKDFEKYDNTYIVNNLVKGYRVFDSSNIQNQVLAPFLTNRILYNTLIQNNTSFNKNGSTYSANLVSSKWENGLFIGTWSQPIYFNNGVLENYSVFVDGSFSGDFYNGFVLGGNFVSNSKFYNGFIVSNNSNIVMNNIPMLNKYRYDVVDLKDIQGTNGMVATIETLVFDSINDRYNNVPNFNIVAGMYVKIPNLFKNIEIDILTIKPYIIKNDGVTEIALKLNKTSLFKTDDIIFIESNTYSDKLFGQFTVLNVFDENNFTYVVIESDFDYFVNGVYKPLNIYPKIVVNKYLKVDSTVINGKYTDVKFVNIKKEYYKESIEIIDNNVIIPQYLQLFTNGIEQTYNNIEATFNTLVSNTYITNSKNIIFNDIDTIIMRDVMVENSTVISNNKNAYIENSILLSGIFYSNFRNSVVMNIDDSGFSNGKNITRIGYSDELNNNFRFESNNSKIKGIYFEGNDYIWIDLETIMLNVSEYKYICLRGFTGSCANVIGSTRSKTFRIREVNNNLIKIDNVFKNHTDFNKDKLSVVSQKMAIKKLVGDEMHCYNDTRMEDFSYAYASPSAFNGGDFYGDFYSVWNSGNFRNGNFRGEWFGSQENVGYNGVITVVNNTVDLSGKNFLEDDYIYLYFVPIYDNDKKIVLETFGGYYGYVKNNNFVIENINIPNGLYSANITRYKTGKKLINDFNFNVDINSVNKLDWNEELQNNNTNYALKLNNNNYIKIDDYINISDNNITIDLLFKKEGDSKNAIISFMNSDNNYEGIKIYTENSNLYLKTFKGSSNIIDVPLSNPTLWHHLYISINKINNTITLKVDGNNSIGLDDISLDILPIYDVCYLGKMLNLESDKTITDTTFNGNIDEFRVWDKTIQYSSLSGIKFLNEYFDGLLAHYNFDNMDKGLLSKSDYIQKSEDYFVFDGANGYTDATFEFSKRDIFIEMEMFPEYQHFDEEDLFKILTLREDRDVPSGNLNSSTVVYSLELLIKGNTIDKFQFIIREKSCRIIAPNNNVNLLYPLNNSFDGVDSSKDFVFDNVKFDFYKNYNVVLTSDSLYIDGVKIGDYKLSNRDLLKNTTNTKLYLGTYEFAKIDNIQIPKTNGFKGFIENISLWESSKYKNEYIIHRIESSENANIYNISENIIESNTRLMNTSENIIVPYFNEDGTNDNKQVIYNLNSGDDKEIKEYLTTSMPQPDWLDENNGNWNVIFTDDRIIATDNNDIVNDNYLLTLDNPSNLIQRLNSPIKISNMDKFRFMGKKLDTNGDVYMNVTANGYLFFEPTLNLGNTNYPLFEYADIESDTTYKQVHSTDAIMMSNILDIRYGNSGKINYVDREDEFVIKFQGISTNFETQNNKKYYSNTKNSSSALLSLFAIRIDKKSSNILVYIRRLGESVKPVNDKSQQKMFSLRRSDGEQSYIKPIVDENNVLVNNDYYQKPEEKEFTIVDKTEYLLFVPKFRAGSLLEDESYIEKIANKDYDYLDTNYGLSVYKQFKNNDKSKYSPTDDYIIDNNININNSIVIEKYITDITINGEIVSTINNDFTNSQYDFNEQYNKNHTDDSIVSRSSFFYDGIFVSNYWRNGIFVGGTIQGDVETNFIWKYGIKYDGVIDTIKPSYWLGGYHSIGSDNIINNVIWQRGVFNGGQWKSGHWLSLDMNGDYSDDDTWSVFNKGVWYSIIDESKIIGAYNPFNQKHHSSVWHGGTWNSANVDVSELYSYNSKTSKIYTVQNDASITLPEVNSTWLGGLWLRGIFNGGIFANGYWNSVDCAINSGSNVYETAIGYNYKESKSRFNGGKMMNSIWYGGTAKGDTKYDVVFGDLLNSKTKLPNEYNLQGFDLYKSDFGDGYTSPILGRKVFNGFHYENSSETNLDKIEFNRVKKQQNSDGVMGVYWKRGNADNVIFQYSNWENLNLDNVLSNVVSGIETDNKSVFGRGYIHSSIWNGGLLKAYSNTDTYPFVKTNEPLTLFNNSYWKRGYWKANGLHNNDVNSSYYSSLDTIDGIEITNAIFSRSLWDSGVFEGGTMENSIWRSGTDVPLDLKYKTSILTYPLTVSTDTNNLAFKIDNTYLSSDYKFDSDINGTDVDVLPYLKNDSDFVYKIVDRPQYRFIGGVDNLASIFVNGRMNGVIWHGGIFMRGMFAHKNVDTVNNISDFYGRNTTTLTHQIGIWNRGLWLSGYFSYYNDRNISDNYLFNNNTSEAGRRCLFMGIHSSNVKSKDSVLGMTSADFNNITSDITNNAIMNPTSTDDINTLSTDDINTLSSIFSRRLIKVRNYGNNTTIEKPYFSIMNGSLLNGIIYQNENMLLDTKKYILSAFASISKYYIATATNSNDFVYNSDAFAKYITHNNSYIDTVNIPYDMKNYVYSSLNDMKVIENDYVSNFNNGVITIIPEYPHVLRHNFDETTSTSNVNFGDGTIVNGINGLRSMGGIQVSIAQGDGSIWNVGEPNGEPKYGINDAEELNYVIYSFANNNGTNGFDNNDGGNGYQVEPE